MHWIYVVCVLLCAVFKLSDASCNVTQFWCTNGECINLAWKCDGNEDCTDGSDEHRCPSTTCADGFFRCGDGKCIPRRWVCDDVPECQDKSDEKTEMCKNLKCDGFRCSSNSHCIPNEWKCDGAPDCPMDEDELDCTNSCIAGTEFQCADKRCISMRWRCDHQMDCDDGSDELKCAKTECGAGEIMCNDEECIIESWRCDGDADCKDRSDELNCTDKSVGQICDSTEFECRSLNGEPQCIKTGWVCDGDEDCYDKSDERSCPGSTCNVREIMCDGYRCVGLEHICDKTKDCLDGEDEKNCSYTNLHCMDNEFDCGNKCISDNKVCNGVHDCDNGTDELHCSLEVNDTCKIDNGGCSQRCVPNQLIKFGHKCECDLGFTFKTGSTTDCIDFDECTIPDICSQICTNTEGSFKCECNDGYTLTNHHSCKADNGGHAELILSDHHDLRRYELDTYHYTLLFDKQISGAVALDFDIRNKIIIWTDVQNETINLANLTSGKVNKVLEDNIRMPEGLALDWIHGNVYLSDAGLDKIEVIRLHGAYRKTLVDKDLTEPRALVVDPNSGWMYWTDWGNKPKIEKCGMNGQFRREIVTKNVVWPNGLTIDYVQQRLYWVDVKLHTIGSSDLDGNNYKVILKNFQKLGHPFAITVFEDYLYWTDWTLNAVHRFNKFGHDNITTIALDLKMPMDIHVYHIYRQPSINNHCGGNNGGCSHLCLPVPQTETSTSISKQFECACPDMMIMGEDSTCKLNTTSESSTQTNKDATSTNNPKTPTQKPTIHLPPNGSGLTTQDSDIDESHIKKDVENVGLITGIVIVVLLIAGLILSVVTFILLKRHKSRNVKTMNFDNPVYRKTTTDDQLIIDSSLSSLSPQSIGLLTSDGDAV